MENVIEKNFFSDMATMQKKTSEFTYYQTEKSIY